MPTVVDSLVVLLNLDASKFTEGQKAALASLNSTKQQAGSAGKQIEASGGQAAGFFDRLTSSALKFGTVLLAGIGLKDFGRDITNAGANLGRMATNIGDSVENLGALGGAVSQLGGDFNAAVGSAYGLSQQMAQFAVTGQSNVIPFFRALGVSFLDEQGHVKTVTQLYSDLNQARQKTTAQNFNFLARGIGLDQDTINLLERTPEAYKAYIEASKKAGVETKEQSDALQGLQDRWSIFDQNLTTIGRNILTEAVPSLDRGLDAISKSLKDHRAVWESAFKGGGIGSLIGAIIGGIIGIPGGVLGVAGGAAGGAALGGALGGAIGGEIGHGGAADSEEQLNKRQSGGLSLGGTSGQTANAQSVVDYFVKQGWTPEQALGIETNLQAESRLDPGASGDGGQAFGVAQWHPDRKARLFAWAAANGLDPNSQAGQLAFVQHELNSTELNAGNELHHTTNAADATRAFSLYYERPQGGIAEADRRAAGATTVVINGGIVVQAAKDAKGIAGNIQAALKDRIASNNLVASAVAGQQ